MLSQETYGFSRCISILTVYCEIVINKKGKRQSGCWSHLPYAEWHTVPARPAILGSSFLEGSSASGQNENIAVNPR